MNKKTIFSALLIMISATACQQRGEVIYEKHQGKEYVVQVSEAELEPSDQLFKRIANECESIDLEKEHQIVKDSVEQLSVLPVSKKMKAQFMLVDNFFEDAKMAEGCDAIQKVSNNYVSLNSVWDLNPNHELKYMVHNHPLVKAEVQKVKNDFGDLYITRNAGAGNEIRMNGNYEAWTGYWFPANDIRMLTGDDSALAKFDRILRAYRRDTGVLREERQFFGGLDNADTWEGHCHAWAMASVVYPEPKRPITLGGVRFSIGELKAILTKAAAYTEIKEYGIRYRGDAQTDGTFQDLVPEAFHLLIEKQLNAGRPVVIDDDAGVEVWTKPVLSMISRIKPAQGIANAVDVTSYLKLVHERKNAEDANQVTDYREHTGSLKLTYRLYHEAQPNAQGKYKVIRGEWTGDSIEDHPDLAIIPNINKPASDNSVLNRNLDVVNRLLRDSR